VSRWIDGVRKPIVFRPIVQFHNNPVPAAVDAFAKGSLTALLKYSFGEL
jgi:hypothetical protein